MSKAKTGIDVQKPAPIRAAVAPSKKDNTLPPIGDIGPAQKP